MKRHTVELPKGTSLACTHLGCVKTITTEKSTAQLSITIHNVPMQ